jgi:alkanesulfonate monooxygenase SsuD/methylene tetrahydromethanopterin reductase-like flavin-dependent oxidoreductase (luciferase family)
LALGTAVLIGALRHPLLAAAQAATVDRLSAGRLILGLGSGAPLPESRRDFDAVGLPFPGRGIRLDKAVTLWRETWSGQGESPRRCHRRG